jgi:hypothetical protein
MKKFYLTQIWEAEQTTCAELVATLVESGGALYCMGLREFICNEEDTPTPIEASWDWIQSQRPNKKVWVLHYLDREGELK